MSQVDVNVTLTGASEVNSGLSSILDKVNKLNQSMGGSGGGGFGARGAGGGSVLGAAGQLLGAGGHYQLGHFVRAIGILGGTGAGSLAAMLPVVAGLGIALGGIAIAGELVSEAFRGISYTATSVMGAITTIGKARNLQEMLVESASNESIAAFISSNTVPGTGHLDTAQNLQLAGSSAKGTEFTTNDLLGGMKTYSQKTGSTEGFAEVNKGGFLTDFASVTKMTMDKVGEIAGLLQNQGKLSGDKTQEAMRTILGIARQGNISPEEIPTMAKFFKFASSIEGNGVGILAAIDMQINKQVQNASQSSIRTRNLADDLFQDKGELQTVLGHKTTKMTDHGKMFTDLPGDMAKLITGFYFNDQKVKGLTGRSREAIEDQALSAEEAGVLYKGQTKHQAEQAVKDWIEGTAKAAESAKEFNDALNKNTASYQIKEAFSELTNEMEKDFLPVMKTLVPYIKLFADEMVKNAPNLATSLGDFVREIARVVIKLPDFLAAMANLSSRLLGVFGWVFGISSDPKKNLESDKEELTGLQRDRETIRVGPGFDKEGRLKKIEDEINRQVMKIRADEAMIRIMEDTFGNKSSSSDKIEIPTTIEDPNTGISRPLTAAEMQRIQDNSDNKLISSWSDIIPKVNTDGRGNDKPAPLSSQ